MSFEKAAAGPGEGIFASLRRVRVRFTESSAAGALVMFDLANTATGLTFGEGGDPGSDVLNTVRQSDAVATNVNKLGAYFFGLTEETQAAGSDGWCHIRGKFTDALVATSTAAGDTMIPAAAAAMARSGAAGGNQKIIAIAATAISGGAADVLFNGIEGLGNN